MPLYSTFDLTPKFIHAHKQRIKRHLLERAIAGSGGKEADWIIRELVIRGTGTPTDVKFADLQFASSKHNKSLEWQIDATGFTPHDDTTILAANSTVPKNKYIVVYGVADLCPMYGYKPDPTVGTLSIGPPRGALQSVRIERSGKLVQWKTEHLYAKPAVVGIADDPVFFDEEDPINILMNFSRADVYFIALRGYTCEQLGDTWRPSHYMMDEMTANGKYKNGYIPGGTDPAPELTIAEITRRRNRLKALMKAVAIKAGISKAPEKEMVFREVVFGDRPNATDKVDISQRTAQTTGSQGWAQDAADLTAFELSNVIHGDAAAEKGQVAANKVMGFYGFADRTVFPDLTHMGLGSGAGLMLFTHVEHCYAYQLPVTEGYFDWPVVFSQNDKVEWHLAFKNATIDKNVILHGLILEHWGAWLEAP